MRKPAPRRADVRRELMGARPKQGPRDVARSELQLPDGRYLLVYSRPAPDA
jgi:hypothetical protein